MAKGLPECVFDFLEHGSATRQQMLHSLMEDWEGKNARKTLDGVLRDLVRRKAVRRHPNGTYTRVLGAKPKFSRTSGKAEYRKRQVTRKEVPAELQTILDRYIEPRTRNRETEWLVAGGDIVGFGVALAGLWADTFDEKKE